MFAFMLLTSVRAQAGPSVLAQEGPNVRTQEGPNCQGPWGGPNGKPFSDPNILGAQIQHIYLTWGSYVESVQMILTSGDLPAHGGSGPNTTDIGFASGEYLIGISGEYGKYLDAISFITNQRTWGPYGVPKPNLSPFSYYLAPGQTTIGFCGRAGSYIDALGIIVKSIHSRRAAEGKSPREHR